MSDLGLPREADRQVVKMMTEGVENEEDALMIQAEYVWDHLMGEPDNPTIDDVRDALRAGQNPLELPVESNLAKLVRLTLDEFGGTAAAQFALKLYEAAREEGEEL